MPKPTIPPLDADQFRFLISKHRTTFVSNMLGAHLFALTKMREIDPEPEVTLCEACDELVDLDIARCGGHQYVSEKALVAYWGSKMGFALAAVMLSARDDGEVTADAPQPPGDPPGPEFSC